MREKTCNICKTKGHMANIGKNSSRGVAAGVAARDSGFGEPLVPALKPKVLSFAKGTKKDSTKESAEGMVVSEVLSVFIDVPSENVEWLGDHSAHRHVCNYLSLLWDVRVREDLVKIQKLSGMLRVHTLGIVTPKCKNKEVVTKVVELYNNVVSSSHVAHYRSKEHHR